MLYVCILRIMHVFYVAYFNVKRKTMYYSINIVKNMFLKVLDMQNVHTHKCYKLLGVSVCLFNRSLFFNIKRIFQSIFLEFFILSNLQFVLCKAHRKKTCYTI